MMADDQALQDPPIHLAPGSRGRAQIIAPYQPHGFTNSRFRPELSTHTGFNWHAVFNTAGVLWVAYLSDSVMHR